MSFRDSRGSILGFFTLNIGIAYSMHAEVISTVTAIKFVY